MLELYHGTTSVCAQKARLTLAEMGLEWKSHLLAVERTSQLYFSSLGRKRCQGENSQARRLCRLDFIKELDQSGYIDSLYKKK